MELDDDAFAAELKRRFGDFLGDVRVGPQRWAYPLSVVHARDYVAPAWQRRGCCTCNSPDRGAGFQRLRDVAALAEIIVDRLRLGLDPGDTEALIRYQKWRKPDNMMMIAATDSLNRLFSNDVSPVRMARDTGLALVNQLPPLKRVNASCRRAVGTALPDTRRAVIAFF